MLTLYIAGNSICTQKVRNVGDPDRRARYESCYEQAVESPYVFQGIAAFEKLFERTEKDLTSLSPLVARRKIRSPTSPSRHLCA